jgi:hypothetical protein
MDNVFLYANYVSLYFSRFAMFCEPVLLTVAVYFFYRAIRNRSALVMLVTQLIAAAQGLFFDIRMLLGPPYVDISHPIIMSIFYFISTAVNLTFYIALILVAIEVCRKLHPETGQEGIQKPLPVL